MLTTEHAERVVVNMGPQHPSTHGVLRLILELDGETVTQARLAIGYLHTGIEKNCEYRNFTQAVTFLTRADYLSPLFTETGYSMAVEKLLGITDEVPVRAQVIRVMMMELNRISSHLVWLGTGGLEIGALSAMLYAFRERELILDIFEMITGLRMNHAYIRPGGVIQDLPPGAVEKIREFVQLMPGRGSTSTQPAHRAANLDRAAAGRRLSRRQRVCCARRHRPAAACGRACRGTFARASRTAATRPMSSTSRPNTEGDNFARFLVRMDEMRESVKIVEQCLDRLRPGPVMVEDKKIAWPAQLALGADGMGNSLDHIRHIMATSMESLIHHFKLVTEGFHVPPGQVYQPIESPRGQLGVHLVSDGGTKPYRVHLREPSFVNLQAVPAVCEGSLIADVIASVASLDPVMGGCDR